jgi:hypothetical protein
VINIQPERAGAPACGDKKHGCVRSHSSERSKFIDGRYGVAATFNARTMAKRTGVISQQPKTTITYQ